MSAATLLDPYRKATPFGVKIALAFTYAAIISVSLWESLVCWPSMIGCSQPWIVGIGSWLRLFVGLLSGPFAPYCAALGVWGTQPPASFLVGYTPILALLVSPYVWFVIRGKTSAIALLIGCALWLLAGNLWCIGIYI